MRVYLAAGFSRKNEIAEKSNELKALGIHVTSQWPWEDAAPTSSLEDVEEHRLKANALRDIQEIDEANTIVLFTQEPTKPFLRGGRMHEFGYAQGKRKRLIVCGPRENIFHYLAEVQQFDTWREAKNYLCELTMIEKTLQQQD
jgi:nucleoside 2-deoxyribosyltransferase